MGICFPLPKTDCEKYKGSEEILTNRVESIQLQSEEFISSLAACNEDKWVLAQENLVSMFSEFQCITKWTVEERIRTLCVGENYVIVGGKNVEIFTHSGKLQSRLIGHERPVNAMCSQNHLLLTGSGDWTLRLWDMFTQEELDRNLINWNVVTSLAWANENLVVQTSEDLRLRLWDIREKKIMKSAVIHVGDNFATCCDARDNLVITGHRGFSGSGCDVNLWDLRKKELVKNIKTHSQSVESVKILDEEFFSCSKDGKIAQINNNGEVVQIWTHPEEKPFVSMDLYKIGILAANIEPKVMFFNTNPLKLSIG